MKFVALIVAAAVTTFLGVADATRLSGQSIKDQRFASKLLQNAKVYDPIAGAEASVAADAGDRHLEDAAYGGITALHSVLFKSCESLSVQADLSDDGDDDGTISLKKLYSQGAVRAQRSYILFDVCLSAYCGSSSNRTTYITDMSTFIQTFVDFIPYKQEQYCEGCQANAGFCQSGESYYTNNGGRKLEDGASGVVYEEIDCDRCNAYSCFSGTSTVDYSLDWIEQMSSCQANNNAEPYYYSNKAVTMGFMCNEDGDGVEPAAFLDDQCILYTNQIAYGNVMSQTEYTYWYNSRQHLEYMFTTPFSCYDPPTTYVNSYTASSYSATADNGQVPATAQWCQDVFQGNMAAITYSDCGGSANRNLEDAADAAADESSQSYTLAEDDVEDAYAVCNALKGLGGKGEHLYDKKNSGTMYNYKKSSNRSDSNLSAGAATGIAFLVITVVAAMGAGAFIYIKRKRDQQTKDGQKKVPLVNASEGGVTA